MSAATVLLHIMQAFTTGGYNWRKHGGAVRMLDISKREEFYQQEYCGCVYSLRDSNRWRMSQGRERIKLGQKFYSNAMDQDS